MSASHRVELSGEAPGERAQPRSSPLATGGGGTQWWEGSQIEGGAQLVRKESMHALDWDYVYSADTSTVCGNTIGRAYDTGPGTTGTAASRTCSTR